MSWEPLASEDPIPGDPAGVAALAARLRAVADTISEQGGQLRDVGAECFWEGDAADGFQRVQEELPPLLDAVHSRYRAAADALDTYVEPLLAAQSEARAALADAREAEAQRSTAERGITAMEDFTRSESQRAMTSSQAGEDPPYQAQDWSGADWNARLGDADDALAAARARLDRAVFSRDRAGQNAAGTVRAAADDSLQDDQSLLGRFKRTVSNAARAITEALPIEELAAIVAVAAAVLVIATLLIPGVNLLTAALVLGVAGLAFDSMVWAADDFEADTGVMVALGVVGLATLGVGRVFGTAARASSAGTGLAGRSSAAGARLSASSARATAAAGRWGRVTSLLTANPVGRILGSTLPGRGVSAFATWRVGANTSRAAALSARAAQAAQRAATFETIGTSFGRISDGTTLVNGGLNLPGFVDVVDGPQPEPGPLAPIAPG